MLKPLLFILLFSFSASAVGQSGFALQNKRKRDRVPFQLVNNLPIIQVEINGTPLSFILDTGVKSTILFSLEDADSLQVRNTSPVMLQGLGAEGSLAALKSLNNHVKVGDAVDKSHSLYIIFDSALNFSPRMGIPIHGILGNSFFKNFIVKMKYSSEVIVIYDPEKHTLKRCRRCEDLPLKFVDDKPYVKLQAASETRQETVTLLVDSGSSDVLWLFDEKDFIQENPRNYFYDFLGLGLSGDIHGRRAKIPKVLVGEYTLEDVNTSFPEAEAVLKARLFKDRDGSLGGGFLKRFTVTFDYGNKLMRFKKNRMFKDPFHYNMSGITLEHEGMELVKEEKQAIVNLDEDNQNQSLARKGVSITTEVHFTLVPKYVVVNVRPGSPAALAGIMENDEVVSINGKPSYEYKLFELIDLFSKKEGKRITMEVNRNGFINKVKFYLEALF
ncbi:pepsin/retropepsin-like aspartic protease family protein [Aequorivita marina]|uniref:pepsin/retropepsin-like aspartic protease family protein n=1 Tax=Aequorivita marina TaxID=3073654 RepID=UPI002875BBD9|nr:aspartyl protease family protein [Aequorivita sp. S2608]MDS1298308.1 aspartyl protease family protein [Aequorivita sp. S2608]